MLYNAICFWMFFDVSYSNKNDLIWFDLIWLNIDSNIQISID